MTSSSNEPITCERPVTVTRSGRMSIASQTCNIPPAPEKNKFVFVIYNDTFQGSRWTHMIIPFSSKVAELKAEIVKKCKLSLTEMERMVLKIDDRVLDEKKKLSICGLRDYDTITVGEKSEVSRADQIVVSCMLTDCTDRVLWRRQRSTW